VRTWAPRGQTPVLPHHFNWKVLSAVAAITWWNFYFRLYPSAIRSPHVIDFLRHLLRHLTGKLLVVWDGLSAHRAGVVGDFIRAQRGRLVIEPLPGYAPELNPAEYIWGYWKHHELPTSARAISPSSASRPAALCAACAGARRSSVRSGAGQDCHYNMQDSKNSSPASAGSHRLPHTSQSNSEPRADQQAVSTPASWEQVWGHHRIRFFAGLSDSIHQHTANPEAKIILVDSTI